MKNFNRKSLLVIVCIALVLAIAVGGTVAYLIDVDGPLTNIFQPTRVTCEVVESFTQGTTTKDNVQIKNTGTTTAYIRAVVVGNWVKDGKIVDSWTDDITYNNTDWTKSGDYWYYNNIVAANDGTTSNLFDTYTAPSRDDGAHLELTIVCQAVQSEGHGASSAIAAFNYVAANDPANK